jgi:hypothetical protein
MKSMMGSRNDPTLSPAALDDPGALENGVTNAVATAIAAKKNRMNAPTFIRRTLILPDGY